MASDRLVESITEQIDRFMETLQGSRDKRLLISSKHSTIKFINLKDESAVEFKMVTRWVTINVTTF
jgi:hypothetical protein